MFMVARCNASQEYSPRALPTKKQCNYPKTSKIEDGVDSCAEVAFIK